MCALADRMSGPLTPKCVNSISPKSEWIFLLFSYTVSATLRRLSPCSIAHSRASSGTSEPRSGVTVWPSASAMRKPSPVEPVAG